ncbi:MAG: SurA N-terminal domain-containing protein [Candidatus Levybacteria bacterium]|nr:SurA N-terminal domain-containing protein [Candidatus Levybacteria bacterium]
MATKKQTKKSSSKTLRSSRTKTTYPVASALPHESVTVSLSQKGTPLPRKRIYVTAAVVALVVLLLFALRGYFIAAMVNGQPISRFEVISQLEKQGGKQILQSLITRDLILQEARKRGVTATQDDINKDLAKIEESYKQQGQTLDSVLKMYGVTKGEVIEQRKPFILLDKMIGGDIKVSDKEVTDFIAKNNEAYGGTLTPEQVKKDLESEKLKQKEQEFLGKLQKDAKVDYFVQY